MPDPKKKIILCLDGTGNDFVQSLDDLKKSSNSNVVRLYTALSKSDNQVIYYHPGVGTMGAPTATHWLSKQWTRVKGLAFGAGFRDNVFSAYRFLMEQYSANGGNGNDGLQDDVYIFGFSRGAYTARALAGLLQGYGLLCPGNEDHLPYAWRMFTSQLADPSIRKRRSIVPDEAFRETYSQKEFPIRFMGLWDTVSSVGWIYSPLRLLHVAQNRLLCTVRHAVSIDEFRCFYQDNLYGPPLPDPANPREVPLCGPQDILQVWFPGVHSDIGGSYAQREAWFSNRTLEWMFEQIGNDLTFIPGRQDIVLGRATAAGPLADLYSGAMAPAKWTRLHKSMRGLWLYLQICPHRYYDHEGGEEYWRVPFAMRRILPAGSIIHPEVRDILGRVLPDGKIYRPPNLEKKFLRRIDDPTHPLAGYSLYHPRPRGFSFWHWAPVRWSLNFIFGILFWLSFVALIAAMIGLVLFVVAACLHLVCEAVVCLERHAPGFVQRGVQKVHLWFAAAGRHGRAVWDWVFSHPRCGEGTSCR